MLEPTDSATRPDPTDWIENQMLVPTQTPAISTQKLKKVLFLSDLDGTWLSKKPENRAKLDREVLEIKDSYRQKGVDLEFGYITARPPERVEKENLPTPDWTITYNGAQINQGDPGNFQAEGEFAAEPSLANWNEKNQATGFSASTTLSELNTLLQDEKFSNLQFQTVGQLVENSAADANEFATGLCFSLPSVALTEAEKADLNANGTADILEEETFAAPQQLKDLASALDEALGLAGVGHDVSPPYLFHGKPYAMLDVASPIANKGSALAFLQQREGVSPSHTIVAGDGVNDISMMTALNGVDEGRRAIVVGGNSMLVAAASKLKNSIIQPADQDSSLGVLDGLRQHLEAIIAEC